MGTEKFMAFKADGTAYRLKGRILRHLDNEPVTDADKSNIRTTLGITSQGGLGDLLAANNLDDVASAATSRTNLDVNSIAQDAESDGTKIQGPSMRFDGSNDYVDFADNDAFSFTNGTDDTAFSVSSWIKMEDATNFTIASKYNTPNVEYLLRCNGQDKLSLILYTDTSNVIELTSDNALTNYEGKWIHVSASYAGAGPNSATSFSNASSAITLYVNGQAIASTATIYGTYDGMPNTSQPLWVGRFQSTYTNGEIRDVKLFNKELSAAEVKTLCLSGSLPESFAESTGAIAYVSDFSAGVDGFSAVNGTVVGNFDSHGGQNDNLRFTADAGSSFKKITKDNITVVGKKYKVAFDYYIPSGNSNIDGFAVADGGAFFSTAQTRSLDAWTRFEAEFVSTYDDVHIWLTDGTATTFDDSGGNDVFYVRNVRVTQIGSVLDARAEQFDTSTGKLYDLSGNDFVGTQSGGVSVLGREMPVYETGTWTPSITFGGGSAGQSASVAGGVYTRLGNVCHISCNLTLTAKGSSTGTALLAGLPFAASSTSTENGSIRAVYAANMASLTSGIEARTTESATTVSLQDWGVTGVAVLDHNNFTDTTAVRFSGTYQIQ